MIGYNSNGNTLLETPSTGAPATYTWDYENRLIDVASSTGTFAYAYLANDRRFQTQTSSTTTQFVWDMENLIEAPPNDVLSTRYTLPPRTWDDLISQNISGTSTFFGFDMSGNTNMLTSSSNDPEATTPYLYRAFGEQVSAPTSPPPFLYGGQGGYYSDLPWLVYVRARVLAPYKGRWENRDPSWFEGGDSSLYRYVANNPLSFIDPSGNFICAHPGKNWCCCHTGTKNRPGCYSTQWRCCTGDPYCPPREPPSEGWCLIACAAMLAGGETGVGYPDCVDLCSGVANLVELGNKLSKDIKCLGTCDNPKASLSCLSCAGFGNLFCKNCQVCCSNVPTNMEDPSGGPGSPLAKCKSGCVDAAYQKTVVLGINTDCGDIGV